MNAIANALAAVGFKNTPICPYCEKRSEEVTGATIYPHRKDLYDKKFYLCDHCDAYVGCHAKTGEPLGRLANKELRAAKVMAHAAFDPIWQNNQMSRTDAYAWLRNRMNISVGECHIGMFDVAQCKQVINIVKLAKDKYGL